MLTSDIGEEAICRFVHPDYRTKRFVYGSQQAFAPCVVDSSSHRPDATAINISANTKYCCGFVVDLISQVLHASGYAGRSYATLCGNFRYY